MPQEDSHRQAARVAKNTAWLTAARVGAKLLSLPLVIVLARWLGPDGFGQWALITSLAAVLSTLADGGFQPLTIRDLAAEPGKSRPYYRKTLRARLVLSGLAAVGLLIWGGWFQTQSAPWAAFALGAALLFPEAYLRAGQALINARERMGLTSALSLGQAGLSALAVIVIVLAGGGVIGALIGLTAVNLAAAWWMTRLARPFLLDETPEPRSARRLFATAFPYGLLALLAIIYFRLDVIMITSLRGAAEAGYYNAAFRLFEAGWILPSALAGALFPLMSRQLAGDDRAGLSRTYGQAVRLLTLASAPAAAAMIFYGGRLTTGLFGAEYGPSGPVLTVLGLSWLLFFVNAPIGNVLAASGLMAKFVPWAAANIGLNVVLNLVLIPPFGAVGAAGATLICEAVSLVIQLVFGRKILGWWPPLFTAAARPLIGGLVAAGIWLLLADRLNPWLSLAIGLAGYLIVVIVIGGLTKDDFRFVRRLAAGSKNAPEA